MVSKNPLESIPSRDQPDQLPFFGFGRLEADLELPSLGDDQKTARSIQTKLLVWWCWVFHYNITIKPLINTSDKMQKNMVSCCTSAAGSVPSWSRVCRRERRYESGVRDICQPRGLIFEGLLVEEHQIHKCLDQRQSRSQKHL